MAIATCTVLPTLLLGHRSPVPPPLAGTVTSSQVAEIHSFYFAVTLAIESWLILLLGELNMRIHSLKCNVTIVSMKDMSVSQV